MNIYQVFPKVGGPSHIVIAKSPTQAINATVNHLSQLQTDHLYMPYEFSLIDITDHVFLKPVVFD